MDERTLLCETCGQEFAFTVAEQEFFRERGFEHDPKRCVPCRRKRRRQQAPREPGKRTAPSAPQDGDAPRRRDRPPRDPSTLHDTVCSACGEPTQVPFTPDGKRPVFCMPCLKQQTR